MNIRKLNNRGVAHLLIIVVVVVVVITGAGILVFKDSRSHSNLDNQTSRTGTHKQAKVSSSASSTSGVAPATGSPTPIVSTTPKATSKSSTSSSTSHAAAPSPTSTPVSISTCLTNVISGLDNGDSVNITSTAITVPGPISDATGRPIVFKCNGKTYFAYHQGSAANFSASASTVASTMAYPSASGSYSLTTAHLDKSGNLVDESFSGYLVGYSQGGN
jgi:hypothetical protein